MNDVRPLAEKMLHEHGEFYPYGGVLLSDGRIQHVLAKDPNTDRPTARVLIDILLGEFRRLALDGGVRATALVFDVRIVPPGHTNACDAVQTNLEHRDGYCIEVLRPYTIQASGAVQFESVFAQAGSPVVF